MPNLEDLKLLSTEDTLFVFLDDVLVGCVIEADSEKGYVVQRVLDSGMAVNITLKGKVLIKYNNYFPVRVEGIDPSKG